VNPTCKDLAADSFRDWAKGQKHRSFDSHSHPNEQKRLVGAPARFAALFSCFAQNDKVVGLRLARPVS
jgi:hypothetical protein